jgi:hypothetical protein
MILTTNDTKGTNETNTSVPNQGKLLALRGPRKPSVILSAQILHSVQDDNQFRMTHEIRR